MSTVRLVAFELAEGRTEEQLMMILQLSLVMNGGPAECWWVAEDDRKDGSDNDSAVFVSPGKQSLASRTLHRLGLTPECNIIEFKRNRFTE